ncbi:MAG: hypothetical protein M3O26_05620 [Pseudomonadota bacterium]|nr:hypothetical protein [Pseudomonadota bacterium]
MYSSLVKKKGFDRPYPHTPDGRYFVVNARLWRLSNPNLKPTVREHWVDELMQARRKVRAAKANCSLLKVARSRVDVAKRALGERGPPWWDDGAPDYNRQNVAGSRWIPQISQSGVAASTGIQRSRTSRSAFR